MLKQNVMDLITIRHDSLCQALARREKGVFQAMAKVCPCRDAIARFAESGKKNSAVFSKLVIPLRTVQNIVKQCKEEGHVQRKPRSGRKRTVNIRRMRRIIKKRIDRMAKQLNISGKSVQMMV
ncbi:hypothetical protein ANCDUO_04516 [Ancylostoma duodenale]|uniref:Paired domain-containing protein n=1 Tax=Ancylostoma duodenale TaxID=51022 RepID=A0A0C2DR11_9BILA|nr:hypothetical protein ANCDUO_04516 [Ancylostoma duodenale]